MKLNILRITGLLGLIVALVFTLVACGDDEPDDPVADFYNGKTVKIVVGHTAGGSYDFFGRTVAQYLSEHIPGNPTVIVENQPSAGSIATANYIASAAPKDGTEIMTSTSGVFMAQVLGSEGVQYDAADFNFLGSGSSTPLILVSSAESGVTSVDEILPGGSKSLKMACGGLGEPLSNAALLAQEFLKANMSMVCGYEGLSAMYLAIEQDEVNGIFTIPNSLASRQANGESVGWTVLGVMAEPGDIPNEGVMAGAPSLYDLAPGRREPPVDAADQRRDDDYRPRLLGTTRCSCGPRRRVASRGCSDLR